MQINVSQLLQEPIGATREVQFDEAAVLENGRAHRMRGNCQLLRTQRSILVKCRLNADADLTCSRCLSTFRCPLTMKFEEEYLPTVDVVTGAPLDTNGDSGSFTINQQHILDLQEAIRQYYEVRRQLRRWASHDNARLRLKRPFTEEAEELSELKL